MLPEYEPLGLTPVDAGFREVSCNTCTVGQTLVVALDARASGRVITSVAISSSVPEAATLALLGIGLAGFAATRRRKLN
jgi:hypothetical protein